MKKYKLKYIKKFDSMLSKSVQRIIWRPCIDNAIKQMESLINETENEKLKYNSIEYNPKRMFCIGKDLLIGNKCEYCPDRYCKYRLFELISALKENDNDKIKYFATRRLKYLKSIKE